MCMYVGMHVCLSVYVWMYACENLHVGIISITTGNDIDEVLYEC